MAINKVIFAGNTLIDISDTTATADKVKKGYKFYAKNGQKITGTYEEQQPWQIIDPTITVQGTKLIVN